MPLRLPDRRVVFDAEAHRYWVRRPPRRELPGLTRILRQAGVIDASYYTEATSNRGTSLHQACALYGRRSHQAFPSDGWGLLAIDSVDPAVRPLVERYRHVIERESITILQTECLVADAALTWATHQDAWIDYAGHVGPLSLKTGVRAPWHGVQLAAEMVVTEAVGGWLLYLDEARPRLRRLQGRHFLDHLRAFRDAQGLFQWRLHHHDHTCFDDRRSGTDFNIAAYDSRHPRAADED